MQIEQGIREIPIGAIDEIEWLRLRHTTEHPDAEQEALRSLGRSMRPLNSSNGPTGDDDALFDTAIGQLAPVRVIRYPTELNRFGKDFGLVFGYRRWQAAKKDNHPTVSAQVIHLTADEYHNDKTRLSLLEMGFFENFHRQDLCNKDHLAALKRIKDLYHKLYPETTAHGRHLGRDRNRDGTLAGSHAREGLAKKVARLTGRSKTVVKEDLQLAELLDLEILDAKYNRPIPKTVGHLLTRLPKAEQGPLLDRLAEAGKPATIDNVEAAVAKRLKQLANRPESGLLDKKQKIRLVTGDPLPDLTHLEEATKLCIELHHRFRWSNETRKQALPIIANLRTAAEQLLDTLHEQDAAEKEHAPAPPSLTKPHHGDNGREKKTAAHA